MEIYKYVLSGDGGTAEEHGDEAVRSSEKPTEGWVGSGGDQRRMIRTGGVK